MKISNLKVQNFKAFYAAESEPYIFDFLGKDCKAKNILLYGENGSGKSSLYWTLHHLLNATNAQWFKKYKNIFAKRDDKNIKIEMNFDNGKSFVYDESSDSLEVDEETREEFIRATKIKTFLTYESIFLINELFERSISIERFIYILDILYGESLHEKLESYNSYRKKFKTEYLKQLCYLDQTFRVFDEEHNIKEFFKKMYDENVYFEDIEKWDKEEDKPLKPFHETVYYYPDEMIFNLEKLKDSLEILRTDFEVTSYYMDELIDILNDVNNFMEDKSESHYQELMEEEKIFVTDFIAIETVDEFVILEEGIESHISLLIEDYEIIQKNAKDLNEEINIKIDAQMAFINTLLQDNFKSNIEITYKKIDFFEFDINNLDNFNPLKFQVKTSDELMPHRYTKFLNEAKISSINFAFYLSIIKSYAELKDLKLLVLDDLLISLDMSNRDIVLDILQEQFSEYQIIFLTHDRAFFEMAKQKFDVFQKNKWKFFEMYANNVGTFEQPYLVKNRTYFEKAEYYMIKHDYPACANYLRKEAESLLKYIEKNSLSKILINVEDEFKDFKLLLKEAKSDNHIHQYRDILAVTEALISSRNYKDFIDDNFNTNPKKDEILSKIIIEIKKMKDFQKKQISDLIKTIHLLDLFSKKILNPLSHDAIKLPIYKKELDDAMRTIKKFKIDIDKTQNRV